jgi:hypothetical protein
MADADQGVTFEDATGGQTAPATAPAQPTQPAVPGEEGRQVVVRPRPPPKPPPAPIAPHPSVPLAVEPKEVAPAAEGQKPPPPEEGKKFEDVAPPPYPGLGTDVAKGIQGGLAEGVEGVLGAPVDIPRLADYGLAWAGAHVNQALGYGNAADWLKEWHGSAIRQVMPETYDTLAQFLPGAAEYQKEFQRVGLDPNYKPQSIGGRYAHEISAFLPGALMPFGEASTLTRVGQSIAPAIGSETLGHQVQGTWAEPWARFLGAGLGGLTQTEIEKAAAPLTKSGQRDIAASMLQESATDPDAALAKARAAQAATPPGMATGENIPGSKPTLSQVTQDPGLVGAETDYQTANAVQHSRRWNAQQEAQANALANVQPGGASTRIADLITQHLQRIDQQHEAHVAMARQMHETGQQIHEQEVQQAEAAARTEAGKVARKGEPEALGARARKAIADSMAAASAKEKALWNAIDPHNKIGIWTNQVSARARNIAKGMGRMEKPMEGDERRIFGNAANIPRWTKLKDLTDLTSDLKTTMRQERITNGRTPALARMAQLLKTSENVIKNAATRQSAKEAQTEMENLRRMTPQDRANVLAARAATRARGDIERGPMGPVLRQGATSGSYRTMESQVPGKIFAKGPTGYQKAKAYAEATGKPWLDPFKDIVSDSLARDATTDGMIDPAKLAKWQADHGDALRALPSDVHEQYIKGPAEAAAALAETAAQRRAALVAHSKIDIAKQVGKSPAEAMRRDPIFKGFEGKTTSQEVQDAVGNLFSQPTRLGQLRTYLLSQPGGQHAAEGLKRAALDHMLERVSTQTQVGTQGVKALKPGTTQKFIAQNKAAFQAAGFTPQQIQMMDRVADDIERQQTLYSTTIPRGSATAQKQAKALKEIASHGAHGGASLLSTVLAGKEIYEQIPEAFHGVAGWMAAGAALGASKLYANARNAGRKSAADFYHDAIMDPDKGIDLLSRPNPHSRARLTAKYGHQAMYGALAAQRHEVLGRGATAASP